MNNSYKAVVSINNKLRRKTNFEEDAKTYSMPLQQNYCFYLYCYFHNVSADISSGLLQVFVELGNLHGTSNNDLYSVSHNRVQVLSIPVLLLACSQDWTCNLQMILSFEA